MSNENRVTRRDFVRDTAAAVAAGAAFGLTATYTVRAGNPDKADTNKILNYNPDMEYRRCGKTNLMISAVCLGGHWKRIDMVVPRCYGRGLARRQPGRTRVPKNRREVVSRCIDRGINYIDACMDQEFMAYAKALKGRRDKMYLGFSWSENEVRYPECRTVEKLQAELRPRPEGSGPGLRRSVADHLPGAEQPAHRRRDRGDDQGPGLGQEKRPCPLHRHLLARPPAHQELIEKYPATA